MGRRKAKPRIGPDAVRAHRAECYLLALDACLKAAAVLVDAVVALSGPDADECTDAADAGCRKGLEDALLWVSRSRQLP